VEFDTTLEEELFFGRQHYESVSMSKKGSGKKGKGGDRRIVSVEFDAAFEK